MLTYAVLVSGTGSNLQALLEAGERPTLVLADQLCPALVIARGYKISTLVLDRKAFGYPGKGWGRRDLTQGIIAVLQQRQVDFILMAGFMTILDDVIFETYGGRVLNLHPSLFEHSKAIFPGAHAVRDALTAGAAETGATIHAATEELDAGPVISEVRVQVQRGDTEATLHKRIKVHERKNLIKTIHMLQDGKIKLTA
jgi:phosphoribosylglycinamide formyltransferase-1